MTASPADVTALEPWVPAKRLYRPGYCEHCDEAEQPVRNDALRGTVCRHCDKAIDEMESEDEHP